MPPRKTESDQAEVDAIEYRLLRYADDAIPEQRRERLRSRAAGRFGELFHDPSTCIERTIATLGPFPAAFANISAEGLDKSGISILTV